MRFHSLPFVSDDCNWCVPETDDYGEACDRGQEYAARFVQYLKENPDEAETGILRQIVSDMGEPD